MEKLIFKGKLKDISGSGYGYGYGDGSGAGDGDGYGDGLRQNFGWEKQGVEVQNA